MHKNNKKTLYRCYNDIAIPISLPKQENFGYCYTLFVLRRKRAEFTILARRTLIAHLEKKKKQHAAHTVPKPATNHLYVQEDLNSTIYAHALINLNSTHNDCNVRDAFIVLRECIIFCRNV